MVRSTIVSLVCDSRKCNNVKVVEKEEEDNWLEVWTDEEIFTFCSYPCLSLWAMDQVENSSRA